MNSDICQKLQKEYTRIKDIKMRKMFDDDENRAQKYTLNLENMYLDYSKNKIDEQVMQNLL